MLFDTFGARVGRFLIVVPEKGANIFEQLSIAKSFGSSLIEEYSNVDDKLLTFLQLIVLGNFVINELPNILSKLRTSLKSNSTGNSLRVVCENFNPSGTL